MPEQFTENSGGSVLFFLRAVSAHGIHVIAVDFAAAPRLEIYSFEALPDALRFIFAADDQARALTVSRRVDDDH